MAVAAVTVPHVAPRLMWLCHGGLALSLLVIHRIELIAGPTPQRQQRDRSSYRPCNGPLSLMTNPGQAVSKGMRRLPGPVIASQPV